MALLVSRDHIAVNGDIALTCKWAGHVLVDDETLAHTELNFMWKDYSNPQAGFVSLCKITLGTDACKTEDRKGLIEAVAFTDSRDCRVNVVRVMLRNLQYSGEAKCSARTIGEHELESEIKEVEVIGKYALSSIMVKSVYSNNYTKCAKFTPSSVFYPYDFLSFKQHKNGGFLPRSCWHAYPLYDKGDPIWW